MSINQKTTILFWSGGWDSTFRLLQLLLLERKKVKPYYIIDFDRKSANLEIKAMEKIKNHLFHKYPESRNLLLPTVYTKKEDITPDEEIFIAWRNIKNKRHIGAQYKWLASFCKEQKIKDIELCIDKSTNKNNFDKTLTFHLTKNPVSENYQIIFHFFSLPLIHTSKKEIAKISNAHNWTSILEETWFCHRPFYIPLYGLLPCGGCNPCLFTIEEGFGHKLPLFSRVFGKSVKNIYNSAVFKKLRNN